MTVLVALEFTSVTETLTPGIAKPDSPRTVPVTDPPATCAFAAEGTNSTKASDTSSISVKSKPGFEPESFPRML